MKNTLKIWMGLVAFLPLACNTTAPEKPVQKEEAPFTFTARVGTDTRVSAEFGDTQNIINFKWSADDSLFVTFLETDRLATLTDVEANALPTFIFKVKSGAGSSNAIFQSQNMIPSEVLLPGKTYYMYAVYQGYFNPNYDTKWHVSGGNMINKYLGVPKVQSFDPSDPLRNVYENLSFRSLAATVTTNSSPVLIFDHKMSLFRIRVKNTGPSPFTVQSIEYPGSDVFENEGWRLYGETRMTLTCDSPVAVAPGNQQCFIVVYQPESVFGDEDCRHIITLDDGSRITVVKTLSVGSAFEAGHMYTTTLEVSSEMATGGGEIPPISGGDEDDF